jgi:ATP-binding cassette subfamily B protein
LSERARTQEEEALGKAYDARLLKRLLRYIRPYRGRVAIAITLLLTGAAVELAGPWLTKIAIDRAIPDRDSTFLGALAIAYIATLGIGFAMQYAQTILTTRLGQQIMYDLRREVFSHLQKLSLPFFDKNPVGRLMTRVTNDVEVLNELFSSGIVTVFGDIFTLLFIVGAMALLDWRLALITLAVIPLVLVAAFFFRGRIREAFRDIRVRLARINAYLQERITGVAIVQLFNRERATAARFAAINRDHLEAHLRSITYYALFFPVMEVLTAVAMALIITYGGFQILHGTVTVGVVAAFLQYTRRFFRPIQDLSEKYNMLQGAMASSERIFQLLDTEPAITEPAAPLHLPTPGRGEIEFRNVWFAYDDAGPDTTAHHPNWVLRDVSFKVRPGERVAIVGHTGAGKTTLINLLMRFYEPQRGEVLFDGVPIDRLPLRELRRRIGLVLQDVFLFSRDVAYNIRLGQDEISDERIRLAAERVGAAPFINRLGQGYHEPLGERGASLSTGERQILSFARALAFDPLVLVLDEATSSVDAEIERQIQHALETLLQGRTSLVIAHRLSTIRTADRILVLHHGELREEGTHQQLLDANGLYARLHELQFATAGNTPPDGPNDSADAADAAHTTTADAAPANNRNVSRQIAS